MSDDDSRRPLPPDPNVNVSRRRFLAGAGATVGAIGAARAAHNTVFGYGHFGMGTNLREQDLGPIATERLHPGYNESVDDVRAWTDDGGLVVRADDGYQLSFDDHDPSDAEAVDAELGLGGRIRRLFVDISALRRGEYTLEFSQPEAFFDRLRSAETRPEAVAAIRGLRDRTIDPDIVETFAGVDPADPEALVFGLVDGFREHTSYDVPRYVAGAIQDNVLFGARDLRAPFEDDVEFEALVEADDTGIFCWELVYRSMEALHAIAPQGQTAPVAASYVSDRRHKHAYTGIASAIRADGELRLPMTFVDYTYSTLYDDFHLRGIRGEGLAAYDTAHRADEVYW